MRTVCVVQEKAGSLTVMLNRDVTRAGLEALLASLLRYSVDEGASAARILELACNTSVGRISRIPEPIVISGGTG